MTGYSVKATKKYFERIVYTLPGALKVISYNQLQSGWIMQFIILMRSMFILIFFFRQIAPEQIP
jgi:hypothetical protein